MEEGLRRATRGKYEGGLWIDQYIHQYTGEVGVDEEIGDMAELGWYGVIALRDDQERPRADTQEFIHAIEEMAHQESDSLTEDEKRFLENTAAILVVEDEQGFVTVKYFVTAATAAEQWRVIEKRYEEFYESQDEPEPTPNPTEESDDAGEVEAGCSCEDDCECGDECDCEPCAKDALCCCCCSCVTA